MEDQFKPKNNEEKKFVPGEGVEKQQSDEEILLTLEKAAENQEVVKITFRSPDDKSSKTKSAISWALEGGVLWITTESGEEMAIELSRIEKVEQKKDQDTPSEEAKEI